MFSLSLPINGFIDPSPFNNSAFYIRFRLGKTARSCLGGYRNFFFISSLPDEAMTTNNTTHLI